MGTFFIILMTLINVPNAGFKIYTGTPGIDVVFWGALFFQGMCLGMWLEKRFG